jgi:hypothetical protein
MVHNAARASYRCENSNVNNGTGNDVILLPVRGKIWPSMFMFATPGDN